MHRLRGIGVIALVFLLFYAAKWVAFPNLQVLRYYPRSTITVTDATFHTTGLRLLGAAGILLVAVVVVGISLDPRTAPQVRDQHLELSALRAERRWPMLLLVATVATATLVFRLLTR